MIISHRHKFIFIAIPKTGTHTLRFALREHLAEDDVEQVSMYIHKKAPYPEIAAMPHGHIRAVDIKKAIGDEMWNSYFKFAVVRNPWDRFVSFAFFRHGQGEEFKSNPLRFMKAILSIPVTRERVMVAPQYGFLCDNQGDMAIDHICRYENLQESFNEVCRKLKLPEKELSKMNSSERDPYHNYYDDELRDKIYSIYKKDIEYFNYSF